MLTKISDQKPEILDFAEDFKILDEVCKINIENPTKEAGAIKGLVNGLGNNIENGLKMTPKDEAFATAFKEFHDKAMPQAEKVQKMADEINT
mmetsp:Transcript_26685/g.23641  ORF Transcript_26685/g.23641 Transcript_26685/m.23641 type:complete len:92 (-) Transcript_26685:342-617(-)